MKIKPDLFGNLSISSYLCQRIKNDILMTRTTLNNFKHYESPEQYAEAFQQMIDARERWRDQIRQKEIKVTQ